MLLTERARELEGELVAAARTVNAAATHGLGGREIAAFMTTLAAITDNLGVEDGRHRVPTLEPAR